MAYRLAADYNVQGGHWTAPGLAGCKGMTGAGPGGCGCEGNCGMTGMGLFESGMDFSAWGWQEWLVVGLGGYVLTSMFFTTKRAARRLRALPGERRRRKAARLGKRNLRTDD